MKTTRVFTMLIVFLAMFAATFSVLHAGKGNGKGGGAGNSKPNPPAYEMTILGTLGGGNATALGLNDYGDVVGVSETSEGSVEPFVYNKQFGIQNLNEFVDPNSGWKIAVAYDINNNGAIAGIGRYDDDGNGTYDNGEYFAIRFLPDNDGDGYGIVEQIGPMRSIATAINNDSDVVGIYWENHEYIPFLWSPELGYEIIGQWVRDGQYPLWTYANDISERDDQGDVFVAMYAESWALRYSTAAATYQELGNLTDTSWGSARAGGVNALGEVVGDSRSDQFSERSAFLYFETQGMSNLGRLGKKRGCRNSQARDINNFGEIVGNAQLDCNTSVPFIHLPEFGMLNLASLITNAPVFIATNMPGRINDEGQICGPRFGPAGVQWANNGVETSGPAYLISPLQP